MVRGQLTSMYVEDSTIPKRVLVNVACYTKLPQYMQMKDMIPDELKRLLKTHPVILHSFGCAALRLLSDEIKERQKRANRDIALFADLNIIGSTFGIAYP